MPSRDYHEALWETLPAGLAPQHMALRTRFLLANVAAGERVLDVGCGEGLFATALEAAGASVVGIDVAEEPLRRARARDPRLELRLVEDQRPWPLPDGAFDVVWAGEVIEHVTDTAGWLSEVRRVLRSGGTLLLTTPANPPVALIAAALSRAAFARRFDPRGDHVRFYSSATLSRLLESFGFEHVRVRCVLGTPGARRLLLARAPRARF